MSYRQAAATLAVVVPVLMLAQPHARATTLEPAIEAGTVRVTVTYKGKGDVDDTHRLWVWLFDTPNIAPGAMPVAEMSVGKNGGELVFEGVTADKVWIAAAYDENGVMAGNAPPPSGTPVGMLVSEKGEPIGVASGDKTTAKLIFDDSFKMP